MDYEKKYKKLVGKIEKAYLYAQTDSTKAVLEEIRPELKESEDERIRKELIEHCRNTRCVTEEGAERMTKYIAWLEKQGDSPIKWNKNTGGNKPQESHSVLMKTTHGIAEGEWKGECWFQYRWAGIVRDSDVLFWIEFSDLEKQGQKETKETSVWHEYNDKIDLNRPFLLITPKGQLSIMSWNGKSLKSVTFGGGGGIILEGDRFAYIDDLEKQGEQASAWSEKDEEMIEETLYFIREYQQSNRCKDEAGMQNSVSCEKWLKSLKQRIEE